MSKCKMNKLLKQKKSQAIFVSMMVSIMVLILVVILSSPLKQEIAKATNGTYSSYLNSSNPSISVEHKATVIILDMGLFYFIGILIASSIAYVSGKRSFTGVITAIMVFIVVSVLINVLKNLIILARDTSHLDCTNPVITVGGSLSCIVTDLWLFYFVITVIAAAVTYIFMTKALSGGLGATIVGAVVVDGGASPVMPLL